MPPKSVALLLRPQRVGVLRLTSFYNIGDGNLLVCLFQIKFLIFNAKTFTYLKIVRSGNSSPQLKTDGFSCHKIYKSACIEKRGRVNKVSSDSLEHKLDGRKLFCAPILHYGLLMHTIVRFNITLN